MLIHKSTWLDLSQILLSSRQSQRAGHVAAQKTIDSTEKVIII